MHICVSNLTIIGSNIGLWPGQRQAIIWTNAGLLLIGPSETNFSEILIKIHHIFIQENAFENGVWKMVAILSQPQGVKIWKLRITSCWAVILQWIFIKILVVTIAFAAAERVGVCVNIEMNVYKFTCIINDSC